ncbi:MAG: HNH endonuclease signature motif containing protein [Hyphomonadaceae bacterium]|nr:HNH endonuclease signature motif containing protein [Hyphomonadaceae bacterium]
MDTLERRFFGAYPSIEPIDPTRDFTHEQRLAIFRRDGGECQLRLKCSGEKVGWENWHADHKLAHSRGGKTTVENGQIACAACNLSKGAGSP